MPTSYEIILYYFLDISSSFCLSAAHNALFFSLDMRTVVLNFLHYFITFLLLGLCYINGAKQPRKKLSFRDFKTPVLTQAFIVFLSNIVHSQERSGSLYLLRIFDFLTTATVIRYRHLAGTASDWPSYTILLPIAVGASLSWLEFGILEYDAISLLLSPILAILQGIQILQIQKYCKSAAGDNPQLFMLHFTGLTAAVLFIPTLYSWSTSRLPLDASWESIDYVRHQIGISAILETVLIGMSIIFMANFKYSELWLQLHLDARNYMILEHTKFWGASIAQWFVQNMAHASIFSFIGKLLFAGSMVRYWGERAKISK